MGYRCLPVRAGVEKLDCDGRDGSRLALETFSHGLRRRR